MNKGVQKLTQEKFAKYGDILGQWDENVKETTFFPDLVRQSIGRDTIVSYSVCVCMDTDYKIVKAEYHCFTDEMILPLDGDCLFYVAPPTLDGSFPYEKVEVFLVPQGTLIVMKPGVWHYAPYPVRSDKVAVMCGLPQCTYMNDCTVIELDNPVSIVLNSEDVNA